MKGGVGRKSNVVFPYWLNLAYLKDIEWMVVFYLKAFSKGGALLMFLSICANVCLKMIKETIKL
jgi:hypothetical protein